MAERLHKFMAACGVASRRKCEELIAQGKVRVNGRTVREMGVSIEPDTDEVEVDGKRIRRQRNVTVAMYKPKGVISTLADPQRRRTVADLLPELGVQLKPVGRLDYSTEGLLLFTSDGDLAQRLTHPRHGVWKTYRVLLAGKLDEKHLESLRKGLWVSPKPGSGLRGYRSAPAKAKLLFFDAKRGESTLELSIHEGRNRQVRNMLETLGRPVLELKRTGFGPLSLLRMRPGECRTLSKVQVAALRNAAGLD